MNPCRRSILALSFASVLLLATLAGEFHVPAPASGSDGPAVAARYHQRSRTSNFFKRSRISTVQRTRAM